MVAELRKPTLCTLLQGAVRNAAREIGIGIYSFSSFPIYKRAEWQDRGDKREYYYGRSSWLVQYDKY